jgi:hypothetical protein
VGSWNTEHGGSYYGSPGDCTTILETSAVEVRNAGRRILPT